MKAKFTIAGIAALGVAQAAAAQTYTQFGNVPIPDLTPGVFMDMVVLDSVIIADLNVGLLITHTWQGDMVAKITHVNTGTTMTIVNRPGGTGSAAGFSADNWGNLNTSQFFVLDDEAANVYDTPFVPAPGISNVTGSWKPDSPPTEGVGNLSVFDGESIQGTWRLTVSLHASDGSGAIRGMQLQVTVPAPAVLAALGLMGVLPSSRRRRG